MGNPSKDVGSENSCNNPSEGGRSVARILDAAANRAAEGLRTIEDYARMILDQSPWSAELKRLRHRLQRAMDSVPSTWLLAARDTRNDCGTEITIASEQHRATIEEVVGAAWGRLQQSLRCLEEYGKIVSSELAREVEAIRYEVYTLEQQMVLGEVRRAALAPCFLYVLVDFSLPGQAFVGFQDSVDCARAAMSVDQWASRFRGLVRSGVDIIQIREKQADDRTLWERCVIAKRICDEEARQARCRLIINDRADIAAAIAADGVHVGQEELPVGVIRRVLKSDQWVGVSTHSVAQARQAIADGADYLGCGPTFPSKTKTFAAFPGLEFLHEVASEMTIPAFAIGGIDTANVGQVVAAGVRRVAVSSALWQAEDFAAVVGKFRELGCRP